MGPSKTMGPIAIEAEASHLGRSSIARSTVAKQMGIAELISPTNAVAASHLGRNLRMSCTVAQQTGEAGMFSPETKLPAEHSENTPLPTST